MLAVFVSAVVVHYEVNVQLRGHLSLNYIQEFPKLTRPVPAMELGNDPAGFQLERGKQRSRSMPLVIVRAALYLSRPVTGAAVACDPVPESDSSHPHTRPARDQADSY